MAQLADELRNGGYRPLPPRHARIPKPSGGERAIAILAVRDRVAQRAVQQVLEPLFDPLFLDCSYGCRPHLGVPEAVARVARYADQGLTWVVDADIADYFDQIDQRILMGLLRQRIDELPVLQLIVQWLHAGALAGSNAAPVEGLSKASGALNLIERAGQAFEHLMPPMVGMDDPYAAAMWEPSAEAGPYALSPYGSPYANRLGTALLLAKPVLSGARLALPYVRRIGGRRLAVAGVIAAGVVAASELARRSAAGAPRGTPQGGALSPLLANIYLHPFDLALTGQGLRLVRFMDDFTIMCASRAEAERALELTRQQLKTLRLTLHPEKTRVISYVEGLEFLGQALAPRQSGPRLAQGLTSFAEAEQALRAAARNVRRRFKR
jgi:RNA-directed DNA polymerase